MDALFPIAPPSPASVLQAANRLKGLVHRTPILRSTAADEKYNAQFFFKCENLQRTGSFKFRGAFNTLAQFSDAQRERGVITFSAGNHAQALALAARLLDMPALVLMPETAPTSKMAATREYGAQVLTYDPMTEDRQAICQRLALERGMTLVPPSEHPEVIAGQGTAALELLEDVPRLDILLVPVGGGGLIAGSLLAVQAANSNCRVVGVEPEHANDAQQSLRTGQIVQIPLPRSTIADGAQAQALGPLAFGLIREHVEDIVTTSDASMVQAMRFFAERMKQVVEPTGALAFAAANAAGLDLHGARVGVLISGGNVDLPRYARFLAD